MNCEELQKRLSKLGAEIPLSTIRRWAYKDGLIPTPIRYAKDLEKRVGKPKKREPGRFSYWTEDSLEAAAAVWTIRYLAHPTDSTEDQMLLVKERWQKDVTKDDIVQGQKMARGLHTLLYKDCKKAANRFRAYLWPEGFSADQEDETKILNFDENRRYSLIPVCIDAVEKVRHHITLNTPLSITYDWTIREDGSSAWRGMGLGRTYAPTSKITLRITHLRPCENGYSNDYGFPHVKEYMRDGFLDEFWLRGGQLGERIRPSPFSRVPQGFYDDRKYADYWDKDPYG